VITCFRHLPSPLGPLLLLGSGETLTGLYLPEHVRGPAIDPAWRPDQRAFASAAEQLGAYFAGERSDFELDTVLRGTAFQREVWARLRTVPFGATTTYGALAGSLGRPTASRAVAGAVARNPLSIVVPCHRVLGHGGALSGYAGGVARKRWLLAHEQPGVVPPVCGAGAVPPGATP
jgi:methylated-DNA-[protein]-cysteine S-methyltransferase